jgi:hypothetical protein
VPILGDVTSEEPASSVAGAPPRQVRLAGVLVGVEGLLSLAFAAALVARAFAPDAVVGAVLGEAAYFVVVGAALAAVGIGLVIGKRWARTPAIVTQLLLLPVVYSLLGPSHQLLLGAVAGAFVITTFLLLISEASRAWWMGLDLPRTGR